MTTTVPMFLYCGCCDHLHRYDYYGDCRNDSERFTYADLDSKYGENGWECINDDETPL